MAAVYEAGVLTPAPATVDNAFAVLWNAGTQRIKLLEAAIVATAGTNTPEFCLVRVSARGTQSSTQAGTPLDGGELAAIATVDFAWTVQPTKSGNYMRRSRQLGNQSSAVFWDFYTERGVVIPAGAGMAIVNPVTVASNTQEAYFAWRE